ncbi:dockerin type I domain-containing protein [Neorhodopirellula lusitana]|nr:dockerin type I domain-containing protein [Neorhodopirellula lusitana]
MPRSESRRDRRSLRSLQRRLSLQSLEDRRVMAASLGIPTGVTLDDTDEFLLGRVAVTPVFLESDGSFDTETEDWSEEQITEVLDKILTGVNWWSDALDQLDTVHSLEFVIDDTYARDPVEIPYEPINRESDDYHVYATNFLDFAGISSSLGLSDRIQTFNSSQREALDTDWAFTIFVADASNDLDGFFPSSGSHRGAFAFAGNGFFVTTSERPASTIAHEMGHIFWAYDEYAGGSNYYASRGYYNTQNTNAIDNPTPGFEQEVSLMAGLNLLYTAYDTHESAASTFALVGWQDSDGNGVFDVLDVPLTLEGTGLLNEATGQFHLLAEASVQTLANQNTSGPQSDITINRVSRLEMSIDGGDWTTVVSPDTPTASFDLDIDVPASFSTISFRVIDAETGITSPILSGTSTTPLLNSSPVIGYGYIDNDRDGLRDADEQVLQNATIDVRTGDGDELPTGSIDVSSFPTYSDITSLNGVTLQGSTVATGVNLQVRSDDQLDDQLLFHVYDDQLDNWTSNLDQRLGFEALFDEPTGYVEVDVIGVSATSYARIEAYNSAGDLISRVTTDVRNHANGFLAAGESQTLTLTDPQNEIVRVVIYGHAESSVAVTAIRYGNLSPILTNTHGAFSVASLPDGEYEVTLTPENTDFLGSTETILVSSGELVGGPVEFTARPTVSPRHNDSLSEDVDQSGSVTAVDALQVINDLNANGSRELAWDDSEGNKVDVNNDGVVTTLDALRIINYLNSQEVAEPEPSSMAVSTSESETDDELKSSSEPIAASEDDDETTGDKVPADNSFDEVLSQPIKWVAQSMSDDDSIRFA